MLAVIEVGGKQYRVSVKDTVYVDLLGQKEGSEIELKNILLIDDKGAVKVGKPYVKGASVKAKVISEEKAPKINGFKYKRRKNYRRRWGHRQRYNKLEILAINA